MLAAEGSFTGTDIDRRSMAVYLLYNARHNRNDLPSREISRAVPAGAATQSGTLSPESFRLDMFGAGARYFFLDSWMADFSAAFLVSRQIVARGPLNTTGNNVTVESSRTLFGGSLLRMTVNRHVTLRPGLDAVFGGGVSVLRLNLEQAAFKTAVAPGLRAGMEWRPRFQYRSGKHLGLGVILNYDFLNRTGMDTDFEPHPQVLSPNHLSIEPTLAVYF